HQGTIGLAAEATIVHDDAMRLGQRGADRLVAREYTLQATWRQDQRRPAARLRIVHLGTIDLCCRHAVPSWPASAARSPLGCLCCSLCVCKAPRQLMRARLWACS